MKFELRPYQKESVRNTINHFRRSLEPAVIVLPTGAGKSLVIAELAKVARGRVLVLAHVKELVEQNSQKFDDFGFQSGIYSAGLNRKEKDQKVIFGSIQSVANANDDFFKNFSLLIIDECHRVSEEGNTQYKMVIQKLQKQNRICIAGLTATPYRLGSGWIYQRSLNGGIKTEEERFFKVCVFELPLEYMIRHKFLTPPVKVDIPVTCYDFSELTEDGRYYTTAEVEDLLKKQKRLTPLIIKNIIDITERYDRQGAMIFSSTVKHAKEILDYLPKGQAEIVLGDTEVSDRDEIIKRFKNKEFKYLVNVSVLTTGFDAPHVDVIAILRPTDSVSLYQQIVGRGLRLSKGKDDCFILDYAGVEHNIYAPEIGEKKPLKESVPVKVDCPKCTFENDFWGIVDEDGILMEHFGRRCKGYEEVRGKVVQCDYRFRFKLCPGCSTENDITARECQKCSQTLIDADTKLKQAKLSKNAHVLTPETVVFEEKSDKRGNAYLDIKYYDFDSNYFSEVFYLNSHTGQKRFNINFLRSHQKKPGLQKVSYKEIRDVVSAQKEFRMPSFIIARKQDKFWKITEKIFTEELG